MRAFRREWRRLYSIFGYRPFALLLAILLGFILVADQMVADFTVQDEAREKLDRQVHAMRQKLGRQKQIEIALQTNQAKLDSSVSRLFSAATPALAGSQMAATIDKWLGSSDIKSNGSSPQAPQLRAEVNYLPVDVSMTLLPQHLIRLLQQLPAGPIALRLNELEIRVSDPDAPSELNARARVEGIYLPQRGPIKKSP